MAENRMKIVVSLGSNLNQVANIGQAKRMLAEAFEEVRFSSEMWTAPIGLDGSDLFLNMVASALTTLDRQGVEALLKEMERRCGRPQDESRKVRVTLDLDLLMYGEERLRQKDWMRDDVMKGVSEVGCAMM